MPGNPKDDHAPTVRLSSLGKEATLLFLSLFYFLIATNTQTGWLFVLSAFLMGVLVLSWSLSRRSLAALEVGQSSFAAPQRNQPLRIEMTLQNRGRHPVQEVRIEAPSPAWASPGEPLRWSIPRLGAGESVRHLHKVVPHRRGEHSLPPVSIVSGAPFGLFTMTKTIPQKATFLVYPEIERLPALHSRNRLAMAVGELVSTRGRGDTRSLRSVRDYTPGDDLRQVHWKASAKRGPGYPLLVREHHAPAPAQSVILLDTSGAGFDPAGQPLFERAVVLAASLMWAAHREGAQVSFLHRQRDGEWALLQKWSAQYPALARVELDGDLDFGRWCEEAERRLSEFFPHGQNAPTLVKAAPAKKQETPWPGWFRRIFLLEDPSGTRTPPPHPGLLRLDGTGEGFQEASFHV